MEVSQKAKKDQWKLPFEIDTGYKKNVFFFLVLFCFVLFFQFYKLEFCREKQKY